MENNLFQSLLNFRVEILKWRTQATKTFMEVSMTLFGFHYQKISDSDKASFRKRLVEAEAESQELREKTGKILGVVDPYYEGLEQKYLDAKNTGDNTVAISILKGIVFEVRINAKNLDSYLMGKVGDYKFSYPTFLDALESSDPVGLSLADMDDLPPV